MFVFKRVISLIIYLDQVKTHKCPRGYSRREFIHARKVPERLCIYRKRFTIHNTPLCVHDRSKAPISFPLKWNWYRATKRLLRSIFYSRRIETFLRPYNFVWHCVLNYGEIIMLVEMQWNIRKSSKKTVQDVALFSRHRRSRRTNLTNGTSLQCLRSGHCGKMFSF